MRVNQQKDVFIETRKEEKFKNGCAALLVSKVMNISVAEPFISLEPVGKGAFYQTRCGLCNPTY